MAQEFIALGHDGDAYGGLETFPNPGVAVVELESDELTAMCPITNQPDNYVTTIRYRPDALGKNRDCQRSRPMLPGAG